MDRQEFRLDGDPKRGEVSIVGDVCIDTSVAPAPLLTAPPVAALTAGAGSLRPVVIVTAGAASGSPGAVHELCLALATSGYAAVRYAPDSAPSFPAPPSRTAERDALDLERVTTAAFERMLPGREHVEIYRIGVVGLAEGCAAALRHASRDSRVKALAVVNASADALSDRATGVPWSAAPVLVVHGERNERAPVEAARALYLAAAPAGAMEVLAGAGHDLAPHERRAAFDAVLRFFRTGL